MHSTKSYNHAGFVHLFLKPYAHEKLEHDFYCGMAYER